MLRHLLMIGLLAAGGSHLSPCLRAAAISFAPSAREVECHDFVEVTITVPTPPTGNPFLEGEVIGELVGPDATVRRIEGFCDSDDGGTFRLRLLAQQPGEHRYTVSYRRGADAAQHRGSFVARASGRQGSVRVDPAHPFHFIRGPETHFFPNSTTAYFLLGWRDEAIIRESLDRLARLRVNRVRVALNGRTIGGPRWNEPLIVPTDAFQYRLEPWPAARPDDLANPGYDVTRFNLAHFAKAERMLRHARELGLIVSLIFHVDGRDPGVDPFGDAGAGGPDERRYYRYAIARLSAFGNVMWDVTNEWHLFRPEPWVHAMGALIRDADPYGHLVGVHGSEKFPYRTAAWCGWASFQCWDERGAYAFMLQNRREQSATSQPKPQINEEYGYEDHYPYPWGGKRRWPLRIAETRRKLAWEMTMAGTYQTTGERANVAGYGGWINGRGNDEMNMLVGYGHLRSFFESFRWWELEPSPDLLLPVPPLVGAKEQPPPPAQFCLARPGVRYVIYLREGSAASLLLAPGHYRVRRFNPRSGAWLDLPDAVGAAPKAEPWTSPMPPDTEDWALWLERR